jgi:serine/threonine-protein kinase
MARISPYALGCTLYYCPAGQSPFPGTSIVQVMRRMKMGPSPIQTVREETPAPLTDLVTRCMATDPDDRPVSAAEVLRDLEGMEG